MKQKAFLKIVLIITALLIATVVGALYLHGHNPKTKSITKNQAKQTKQLTLNELLQKADVAVSLDKYDEGQTLFKKALAVANTKAEQTRVELAWALADLNSKHYTGAVGHAQKAEKLTPTAQSAKLIATADESLGNKSDALKYYKISFDRIPTTDKKYDPDITLEYNNKVTALAQ